MKTLMDKGKQWNQKLVLWKNNKFNETLLPDLWGKYEEDTHYQYQEWNNIYYLRI